MRTRLEALLCILSTGLPITAAQAACTDCDPGPAAAIEATYTGEVWRQASGGVARGTRYLDNLDLTMALDGERLLGVEKLQIFGYLLYNNGHSLCEDLVGSAQCVSNIEATRALKLYELWTERTFGEDDAQSLRFGLYDLNSEFDSIESASVFIQPSHGIGPDFAQSGANGPSIFPTTALAVRASRSFGAWSAQAAAVDGAPGDPEDPDTPSLRLSQSDGALVVGEINYRLDSGARLGGGYWRYTADFPDLNAVDADGAALLRDDNAGAYLIVESATVFDHRHGSGLNLFFRSGFAEGDINAIGRYFGAGGVYHSESTTGFAQQLGLAVAVAELGTPFRLVQFAAGSTTTQREYNYEVAYRVAVADWLTLQSDVQYTRNPAMNPARDASWTFGVRFEVARRWEW